MCFFTLLFCYTALSYNIDGELMYHIREKTSSYLEVKKSKFIGILIPIDDEKRLKEHLNQLKKEYPAATHYCYGAIIGQANRSNDDGEPASTAGKPILEALKNHDLDNVLCVVVRYFGGTLLGTAGLIKAYGQAATLAIEQAQLLTPTLVNTYRITVDYSLTSPLEHLLQNHAVILDRQYGEKMTYIYSCRDDLTELLAGNVGYDVRPELIRTEIIDM